MEVWAEVESVKRENRHELILSGDEISNRIKKSGLDKSIFSLVSLNLLRISDTCLDAIGDDISKLVNLQSLILHSNKLTSVPNLSKFSKLKMLDMSRNELIYFPEEVSALTQLTTLNLSGNKLEKLPSFVKNVKLTVLNLSNNKLTEFPDICSAELVHLAEVNLSGNLIHDIPVDLKLLPSLKMLDASANKIDVVPGEISEIPKLKEINLKGNPIKDRRFLKLIDQCRSKQVLDYIRQNCTRQSLDSNKSSNKKLTKRQQRRGADRDSQSEQVCDEDETQYPIIFVERTTDENHPPDVIVLEAVRCIRGYILCCVMKNIEFDEQSLRKFIQMQTRLHESVCGKRNLATIATHDLAKLGNTNLTYKALEPNVLKIKPLARPQECTGEKLFERLKAEAEAARKEKKRNTYPAVHRYLHLLEGVKLYPCLTDVNEKVVSFPPITNSDCTKITLETKSIFVEVTSSTSQDICRQVLDTVLKESLMLGIGGEKSLTVQRVRILDPEGTMRAVYPSKPDLNFGYEIKVIREQEKQN